jgi:hypothetical protein
MMQRRVFRNQIHDMLMDKDDCYPTTQSEWQAGKSSTDGTINFTVISLANASASGAGFICPWGRCELMLLLFGYVPSTCRTGVLDATED